MIIQIGRERDSADRTDTVRGVPGGRASGDRDVEIDPRDSINYWTLCGFLLEGWIGTRADPVSLTAQVETGHDYPHDRPADQVHPRNRLG